MSMEFDMLTTSTRGFVSGIFFCSLLIWPILEPNKNRSFVLLGLGTSLAYIFNPNALVFALPVLIYVGLNNLKNLRFYLLSLASIIPAILVQYFARKFYDDNPEYLVRPMWELEFSWEHLATGLGSLDQFFRYLSPVIWGWHWMILLLLIGLGTVALRKDRKEGIALLSGIVFIVLFLGINKTHDDIGTLFLGSNRMFLALRLLLGLAIHWSDIRFPQAKWIQFAGGALILGILGVKFYSAPDAIQHHTKRGNFGAVAIKPIDDLKKQVGELQIVAKEHDVDLIVLVPGGDVPVSELDFYNYGSSLLEENAVPTVLSVYERRTWEFEKNRGVQKTSFSSTYPLKMSHRTTLMKHGS